jgi:hypothetical protein
VYEQFLGKVIRLTKGHQAKVEEKPEVKKAGGVYYTPTFVVDYIVKKTVGKLLEGKTPKQVAKLRILDPACGSGSFLIGAYQFLLNWHLDRYVEDDPQKLAAGRKPVLFQAQGGDWRLTTSERKRILLNTIYGVDIDAQAVEVTKLSLLLKVLEGENEQTISQQIAMFNERALPDLGSNIKCGNSLIGPDFYEGQQLTLLDDDEKLRVNAFDWKREFTEIMNDGGFDAVIGNPPYVRQETLGPVFKKYASEHYAVYHGVADLYAYFIEQGVKLLREGGAFGYIVANKWLRANYGEPLRKWLKGRRIMEIIDFGDLPVFEGATTYPCILRIEKGKPGNTFPVTRVESLEFPDLAEYCAQHQFTTRQSTLDDGGWSLSDEASMQLLAKIKAAGIPLSEYVDGKIYYGIKTGLNEAFVIDKAKRDELIAKDERSAELIKPFLVGRDIKRYGTPSSDRFVIFSRRGVDIHKYPAILSHLSNYKARLMPRPANWKGDAWVGRKAGSYQWYEIQDTVDYHVEFDKPKILWPGISDSLTAFAFDSSGYYGNDNNQLIIAEDKFLLGVLNSRVAYFVLSQVCDRVQGGFYRLKISYVSQLPIRCVNGLDNKCVSSRDHIVKLVGQMLDLHKKLPLAKTDQEKTSLERQIETTDRQIDELVYELYGITEEERKIIEG